MSDDIVVIPEELLAKATPEEREAYFQYLLHAVVAKDEWEPWIKVLFPHVAAKPFSDGQREFWEWAWNVEPDVRPRPFTAVWSRGHAKSSSSELAAAALGARGVRKYGLYICHEKGTPILDPDSGEWMEVQDHPSAAERVEDGLTIKIAGLPFTETVTLEHRYWARRITPSDRSKEENEEASGGWVEARHLDRNTWIGLPIDVRGAEGARPARRTEARSGDGVFDIHFDDDHQGSDVGDLFIEDGFLWSRVKNIAPSGQRTFVPITTSTGEYVTAFAKSHNCETQEQADDHVANVAALLESEALGIAYPGIGEKLLGKHGNAKGWRRNRIRTQTGFTLDAMGLDSAARGVKLESQRPDLLVVDDVDNELDTEEKIQKKIKTITRKLLPAGSQDCAILLVQNLVHENSIFARLVDGRADFVKDRIVSGPIPAIHDLEYEERDNRFVITGGTPSWPEGFPLESCQLLMNDIGLTAFLAECQHETKAPDGDIFSHITFSHIDRENLPKLTRVVVWVDPSVTSTDSSDSMGIQIDGLGVDRKVYRLFSWEQRATPYTAVKLAVRKALEYGAEIVGIETNQGGDLWRSVYDQVCEELRKEHDDRTMKMPRYKERKATADMGSKINRAQRMLVDYESDVFVHVRGTHHTLEASLKRFPKVKPFDLVDAAFWSWSEIAGSGRRRKGRLRGSARKYLNAGVGIPGAPSLSR